MKSKFNPLLFRSLATGAALFAIAPLHATEFDTTGTTVTLSPQNRYIGNGTLEVSGGGAVWLGGEFNAPTEFAMTGGVIDIVSGTTLVNGGWQKGKWGENKAGLQVNGTLDVFNGEWIAADALTGSGAVTMPDVDGWYTAGLVLGLNNGGGTFTGTISDPNNGTDNIQLHKYGTGTQILTGTNTYSSSTVIGGGTLQLGNGTATGSLSSSSAISVSSGATFVINQNDTVTQGTDFSSAAISGAGGFTQAGAGTTVLNTTNTYTGATTVSAGTLILGDGTNNTGLADTADVSIASGATLQLDYLVGNTDTINKLFLGGVQVASGTWGSLASGATHTSALITGSGLLDVITAPITDPFANWMTTNYPGILTPDNEPGADPDNDGIANLMEYILQGGDPSVSTTGTLPTLNASGANFVFTYYRRAAATGTTQTFEYSTTLGAGSWTPVAIPGGAGVVVTDQGAGIDKVEITVAKGAETKLFGRLQVVK